MPRVLRRSGARVRAAGGQQRPRCVRAAGCARATPAAYFPLHTSLVDGPAYVSLLALVLALAARGMGGRAGRRPAAPRRRCSLQRAAVHSAEARAGATRGAPPALTSLLSVWLARDAAPGPRDTGAARRPPDLSQGTAGEQGPPGVCRGGRAGRHTPARRAFPTLSVVSCRRPATCSLHRHTGRRCCRTAAP